jgi:hypothetical protein
MSGLQHTPLEYWREEWFPPTTLSCRAGKGASVVAKLTGSRGSSPGTLRLGKRGSPTTQAPHNESSSPHTDSNAGAGRLTYHIADEPTARPNNRYVPLTGFCLTHELTEPLTDGLSRRPACDAHGNADGRDDGNRPDVARESVGVRGHQLSHPIAPVTASAVSQSIPPGEGAPGTLGSDTPAAVTGIHRDYDTLSGWAQRRIAERLQALVREGGVDE